MYPKSAQRGGPDADPLHREPLREPTFAPQTVTLPPVLEFKQVEDLQTQITKAVGVVGEILYKHKREVEPHDILHHVGDDPVSAKALGWLMAEGHISKSFDGKPVEPTNMMKMFGHEPVSLKAMGWLMAENKIPMMDVRGHENLGDLNSRENHLIRTTDASRFAVEWALIDDGDDRQAAVLKAIAYGMDRRCKTFGQEVQGEDVAIGSRAGEILEAVREYDSAIDDVLIRQTLKNTSNPYRNPALEGDPKAGEDALRRAFLHGMERREATRGTEPQGDDREIGMRAGVIMQEISRETHHMSFEELVKEATARDELNLKQMSDAERSFLVGAALGHLVHENAIILDEEGAVMKFGRSSIWDETGHIKDASERLLWDIKEKGKGQLSLVELMARDEGKLINALGFGYLMKDDKVELVKTEGGIVVKARG